MSETRSINPAMLTLAREARGMTQTDLARTVGVSQPFISNIEAGLTEASEETLEKLAVALQFPTGFFFQTDAVYGPGLSEFFHRKRQDVPVKTLKRIHAEINIIRIHVARLLRSVDPPECRLSPLDIEDFDGNPSDVARAVRASLGIPAGPIQDVIKTIEDAGGFVVRIDFGTPRVDAITRQIPGLPPIFFVNAGLPTDRERFTLCHELGHVVMHHRKPTRDMETEANRFSAEFLMPERDIGPQLDRINLHRVSVLKTHWKVAMAAIIYRAAELGKITERGARSLRIQMSARGLNKREPPELDLPPEYPALLGEVLDLHRSHYGYGIDQFKQVLVSEDTDLMRFYGLGIRKNAMRPRLRLVN